MNLQIPIIALTADVTTADLEKCKAVGMNDYISKPVDERLLYGKIIDLYNKPTQQTLSRSKCVDLTYLYKRTKGNSELMMEMIALYLEQTPTLIEKIKEGVAKKEWDSVAGAAHKIIPSFSIMGIHKDFENMSIEIKDFAGTRQHLDKVEDLVIKLETVCYQACKELKEEYNMIKKTMK
jgi:CheY-like chemotaxis protein